MPLQSPMGEQRTVIYCLVPEELAGELLEPLREHYRGEPGVEVIVDGREGDRRVGSGRHQPYDGAWSGRDRRLHDRRRPVVPRQLVHQLPRELAARASSVRWVQRLGPVRRHLAEIDLERLLIAVAQGHDDALAELYWRYVNRVGTRLAGLLDDPRETEGAIREAFGRLFDRLPGYDAAREPFKAFVDAVVDAVVADRSAGASGPSPEPGDRRVRLPAVQRL